MWRRVPMPVIVISTLSPACRPNSGGTMTPVPVETTVPTGMGLLSIRYSVSSSKRRLIRSVPTDSSKMTCPSRSITQRTSKLYGSVSSSLVTSTGPSTVQP